MPKKNPESPDGMICAKCGADKTPYHYFNPRNQFNTDFFVNAPDGKTCWACGGDYRCICCHQTKPHSEYRVQGRICNACKRSLKRTKTRQTARTRLNTHKREKVEV
jgi:hypothetical protein